MADGKVDFSGNWEPNAIRQNVDLPYHGSVQPPLLPWAEQLYIERKGNISKDDPEALCLPPGVPRMSTTPAPWTMMQNDKQIIIVYEGGAHVWRKNLSSDGKPSQSQTLTVETCVEAGNSTGHWQDNDTLGSRDRRSDR